jgi:hypothetical protein
MTAVAADHPLNAALLETLKAQGVKGSGDVYDLDGWQLHTHPDLCDHLQKLCPACYGGRYGVAVLTGGSGVIFALAKGTSTLAFRLTGTARSESLEAGGREFPDAGDGWVALEAWRTPPETLKRWCRVAQAHATPIKD